MGERLWRRGEGARERGAGQEVRIEDRAGRGRNTREIGVIQQTEKIKGKRKRRGRGVGLTLLLARAGEEEGGEAEAEIGNTAATVVIEQGSIFRMTGLTRGRAGLLGTRIGGTSMTTGGIRRSIRKGREWREIITGDKYSSTILLIVYFFILRK